MSLETSTSIIQTHQQQLSTSLTTGIHATNNTQSYPATTVPTFIFPTTKVTLVANDTIIDKRVASNWSKKINGVGGASARFVEYLPKTPAVRLPQGHGTDVSGAFALRRRTVVSLLGLFELSTRYGERPEGRSELAAARLAVKHINSRKLLPGYTLELLTNDTQVRAEHVYGVLNMEFF